MGKHKKSKKKIQKRKKIKYQTRREMLLSQFPEPVLNLWFGDDSDKRNEFGNFLMMQDELDSDDSINSILDGKNIYDQKIEDIRSRKHKTYFDLISSMDEVIYLTKKSIKNKKYSKLRKSKDLSLATYLDSSRYGKKYMDTNKYRKQLKKIAKNEKDELKEMRKLGYIRSDSVDDELKRLKKASSMMSNALNDAYTQKHFLE